jgi:hypothetical protein
MIDGLIQEWRERRMKSDTGLAMPLTTYLSAEGREAFARSLERVLREHWGPDRFEIYRKRFTPPEWLAKIPQLPERDKDGRLPDCG